MREGRTVQEAKRFGVFSCRGETPLGEAARQMVNRDVSALVVVDAEGYLTGILSRTDLLRAHLAHADWATHPVSRWMSADVVTVSPDTRLEEVARLLLQDHIHRVVAVRREEDKLRPVSVISDSDLVYHMCKGCS